MADTTLIKYSVNIIDNESGATEQDKVGKKTSIISVMFLPKEEEGTYLEGGLVESIKIQVW